MTTNESAPDPTAGERVCAATSPSEDWVPGVWPDHEHRCVTHARDEHECACGAKWGIDEDATPDADDAGEHRAIPGVRAHWPARCVTCDVTWPCPDASTDTSEPLTDLWADDRYWSLVAYLRHSLPAGDAVADLDALLAAREAAAATKARADERERIVQAIEAQRSCGVLHRGHDGCYVADSLRIARDGGR